MGIKEFQGRVALVTAAAGQGIGRAIATRLAAEGAEVILTDSHPKRVVAAAGEIAELTGAVVHPKSLDMGRRDDILAVTGWVAREVGPISILVNNAAHNEMGSIFDYDPEVWDRVLSVNLSGPWLLSKQAMIQMRDSGAGGAILNISTYAPDVGGLGLETPYAVSKGGLNVLTRCCAHEGGPFGIRVNTLTMGVVTGTRFIDVLHPEIAAEELAASPLRRLPDVSDIVEAATFLLSDRSRATTGEIVNVAAGRHMRY
ncbi:MULTISPECIES: SDR family oxidoreductase [unclassified Mycolicibacterium]|uniref:SDR family NAD(P)-dependent oxidoreductase n=3 Tax=Mycolicibacterium TaxID=1866885 RepID=UPI0012DE44C6|nr:MULTISPECIES: SDR family oxidoreductase [unclassified Mycolicibacterium]MUM06733.1 3-oxoacyl-ACP reductase [Mycolicibacterium sp. CBMA 213]